MQFPTLEEVAGWPVQNQAEYLDLLDGLKDAKRRNKLLAYFPDTGPLCRNNYPKHMQFFRAGTSHRQRCVMAANRVGKTETMGGYEMTLHLTGRYPDWWEGRQFDGPISAWAAGDTNVTVRDIIQFKLLGKLDDAGTGLIPADALVGTTRKAGVRDSIDTITVAHASGGKSTLTLKSYEQGRKSFQGTEQDVIWLDEEPPEDVLEECLIRTMTTHGMVMCTFTPLSGMTTVAMSYLPQGEIPESADGGDVGDGKHLVMAGWDDAPHLGAEEKEEMLKTTLPYQREARSKGIPSLGSGAIYPVGETEFVLEPFQIPDWWPRGYGMDVGWNRTAAIWGALDRETDTLYLYSEHYRGKALPSIHAAGIKARGSWIPGRIDPAARGRGQKDGEQLLSLYQEMLPELSVARNDVEAGIFEIWERLSTGRLKVFSTCRNWLGEYRLYRRDQKGQVVKENDHLMDATRYLGIDLRDTVITKPTNQLRAHIGGSAYGDTTAGY